MDEARRLQFDFKLADIGDSGIRPVERPIGRGRWRPCEEANANDRRRRDPYRRGFAEQHTWRLASTSSHVRAPKRRRRFGAFSRTLHYCARHGERSLQFFSAAVAQPVVLSVWQRLQAFGIFNVSVCAGQTKRKVWLRTFTSAMVSAIGGIWQAMHALPALPAAWCVCCSMLAACGPFWVLGPWQVKQSALPGSRTIAWLSVPCGSWQLKQVTPRAYIRLSTKSLPCMRFLCAVPSAKCVKLPSPSLCSSSCQKSARFKPT